MVCPLCDHPNPEESVQCEKCSTPLPISDQTLGTGLSAGWSLPVDDVVTAAAAVKPLAAGTLLGDRYEIIRLLGQGGMGAVYQAHDRTLDRQVALKLIRGDMAANQEILKRFKQELILARQITHKNVIRIFDLGQAGGSKFITMEYIEGEDLQSLLKKKGKFAPGEAAGIIAQVCRALEVAHAEGVIHRDLKPQNIMVDKTGRAYVMDFGIARSVMSRGMTQTGALIGTPDYMSPEQAKGQTLDARSDLFSVGIIFYEMLSGVSPFTADTTMGKLWKRTSEPARPLRELDQTIPAPLNEIVKKCLEIDPQKRFASATELLEQIENWQGPEAGTRVLLKGIGGKQSYAKWAVAGAIVVLLALGLWIYSKVNSPPVAAAPASLLIADFENKTGDPVFDGTLESVAGITLEGAPFLFSYDRGQAKKEAIRLQPRATRMDAAVAQSVAVSDGMKLVITGSISKQGNGYDVQLAALDAATGKPIVQGQQKAASRQDVLSTVVKVAEQIRKSLGDATIGSSQKSRKEAFSAESLEATKAYAMGQELQQAGHWEEAVEAYGSAVRLDPNMGLAYAGMAGAYANLGKRAEAEKSYEAAIARIDKMTDREKYRTRASFYSLTQNQPKAIETLTALVKQFPADIAGRADLALAYFRERNMTKALEEQKHALEIMPRSVEQHSRLSEYALYAGDSETAEKEAREVLKQDPKFETGVLTLALAKLAQGHADEAQKEYQRLREMSSNGNLVGAAGLADVALYEGRLGDAAGILQKAMADIAGKDIDRVAEDQAMLAETQMALNKSGEAIATATKAAFTSKEGSVLYQAARVFLGAGQEARGLVMIASLNQRPETGPQNYAKLIAGEAQLKKGNAREAVRIFEEAQKLSDTWLGRFDLGRAYLDAGAFPEASSEFDVCLKRRGEASSVFLNDVPSFHFLPAVYYFQGRAREGLKSPDAAESYKTFLAIKQKGSGDPLVADAARRLASLK